MIYTVQKSDTLAVNLNMAMEEKPICSKKRLFIRSTVDEMIHLKRSQKKTSNMQSKETYSQSYRRNKTLHLRGLHLSNSVEPINFKDCFINHKLKISNVIQDFLFA